MPPSLSQVFHSSQRSPWAKYSVPLLVVIGWTALIHWGYPDIDIVNLAMTYLLANVIIAVYYGQGPATTSSILSVVAFDYLFINPRFKLTVENPRFWITFLVMFTVTIVTSRLTVQSRRSAEKALTAEMEAERERVMSSLLSSVSHDLRTPLTSISGAAGTLLSQESKISAEDRRYLLQTIDEESSRLNRLVEKILQITRIESGSVQAKKELHSLEELIGSVLYRMDSLLEGRKITTEVPGDLFAPLDALLMEQVLVNILENALRYTPAGSPIELRVSKEGAQVSVEIWDRGPGVPAKDRSQIFEKFYRIGKRDSWGSGLGLAICHGILKIHQGDIGGAVFGLDVGLNSPAFDLHDAHKLVPRFFNLRLDIAFKQSQYLFARKLGIDGKPAIGELYDGIGAPIAVASRRLYFEHVGRQKIG